MGFRWEGRGEDTAGEDPGFAAQGAVVAGEGGVVGAAFRAPAALAVAEGAAAHATPVSGPESFTERLSRSSASARSAGPP